MKTNIQKREKYEISEDSFAQSQKSKETIPVSVEAVKNTKNAVGCNASSPTHGAEI